MTGDRLFPLVRASVSAIMLFQVAALFARSFLQGRLTNAGFDIDVARNLSYLVVPAVEFVLLWPILRHNKNTIIELFSAPDSWTRMISTAVALGLAARLCGWATLIAATSFGWFSYADPGFGNGPTFWLSCPPAPAFILAAIVTAILIPIGEEVINRGLILGTMIRQNYYRAIIASAVLFAILHAPQGIPAAFCIGLLLAIQTIRSRSLLPAIISHATFNFLRILDWFCLHSLWHPESANATLRTVGSTAAIVGLLSLGTAIWLAAYAKTGAKVSPRF